MSAAIPVRHLVFSTAYDPSTDQVLDWMASMGGQFLRLNTNSQYIEKEDALISAPAPGVEKFRSIWFRKICGLARQDWIPGDSLREDRKAFRENIDFFNQYIERERKTFYDYFYRSFQSERILSPYESIQLNKLDVLRLAAATGMDTPKTLVTRKKDVLERFRAEIPQGVINKSIAEHLFFEGPPPEKNMYSNYTEEITDEIIREMPDTFDFSLFQEKLDKAFEARVFYLDGASYSMAVFSQDNARTSLDFRRYDKKNPNRLANFRLDERQAALVHSLMQQLGLNTGSLDLVRTRDGRMVFLEVNPAGQFGMVSQPCNYHLEKRIASFLTAGNER